MSRPQNEIEELLFRIVAVANGWRSEAEAEDEGGALCAARELRRDYRDGGMVTKNASVAIYYEGEVVLSIPPERKI